MRPPPDLPPVDYLVLWQPYRPGPAHPWWWRHLGRHLVKPGFAHVLVVMIDPAADVLTVLDPVLGGLAVRNIPLAGSLTRTCAQLACNYPPTTYCLLQGRRRDRFPARARWGLTCVSVVAAILGLETTPLTPWRLYRHVLALAEQDAALAAQEAAREVPRPDRRAEGSREGGQGAAGAAEVAG